MVGLKHSASWTALAATLAFTPAAALAQQAPDTAAPAQQTVEPIQPVPADRAGVSEAASSSDVVVTGTRVGRPNIASTAPILSITSEEIKAQGATSVSDILNRLPQVAPDNQATYQDSNGAQQVQLRGFGFNRTLSLIDGQRISTSSGVNVNSIPVALIDRVDVLTGGASAIYGADAVAGVINFILKKDYKGLQINGSYSLETHDNDGKNVGARTALAAGQPVQSGFAADGAIANVNAAWGGSFFDDRVKLQVYGGYIHTDPILNGDRDFASCYLTQSGVVNSAPTCTASTSATTYGVFRPAAGGVYSLAKDGSRTLVPNDASFSYNPYSTVYLQHGDERYNAGAFTTIDVTDHLELYGTYMFSYDHERSQFQPAALFNASDYGFAGSYTINCNNPFLSAQQRTVICGAAAGAATQVPIGIRYRFNAVSPPQEVYNNNDQRITAGVRGSLFHDNAVKYDVNFVYSSASTEHIGNPYYSTPSYTNIQNALNVVNVNGTPQCASGAAGCVPLDVFQANSGTAAQLNYIFGNAYGHNTNISYLYDYSANITADFGKFGVHSPFAEDGPALAFGLERRLDKQRNTADAAFLDQFGYGGPFGLSQSVNEAYAELNLPTVQHKRLVDLLSFNGSIRGSKYSIGPKVFTTWELGAIYAPVSDVSFRVSYNKASRQPTVYEYGNGMLTYGGGSGDPCAGATPSATQAQCAATGVTAAQYGHVPQCDNNSCLARNIAGHPNPETAKTLTYGLLLKPRFVPGLTFSVDHYKIEIEDQIGYYYDSDFVNGCLAFQIPFYCQHIFRNPDGSLTSADLYRPGTSPTTGFVTYGTGNFYKYSTSGFDFQGQYTVPVAAIRGSLNFIFNGTLQDQLGGQDDPTFPAPRNAVGYYGPYAGIPRPRWSHTLRSTYTTTSQAVSLSLNWRHIGGTETTANSGDPLFSAQPGGFQNPTGVTDPVKIFGRIPAYNLFDLNLTFRVAKRYSLTFLANNILDATPPILPDSYNVSLARSNTIPQTYDSLGRKIQVAVTVNF